MSSREHALKSVNYVLHLCSLTGTAVSVYISVCLSGRALTQYGIIFCKIASHTFSQLVHIKKKLFKFYYLVGCTWIEADFVGYYSKFSIVVRILFLLTVCWIVAVYLLTQGLGIVGQQ